jgi:hypothetical protein
MFTVDEAKKKEVIVNAKARGYNLISGIAILMNQFKEASHKNLLKLDDGKVSLNIAYSKDNDKNLLTIDTDENGAIHLNSNDGKFKFDVDNSDGDISSKVTCNEATVEINKDSEITVANSKASAEIDKDGAVTITSNSNTTVSIDKNGNVTINANGKISLKNNSANLFTILNGMLNILNTSLATQGSPASHTVVPSQFQQQQTQLGQLMQ